MSKNTFSKKLCFCAVMAALYVGLDYLSTTLSSAMGGSVKISLNAIPVIITAVCIGPLWAAASGFTGAFIGQLITYGLTATTVLWTLPAVLRGLSVGLLFIALGRSLKRFPLILCTVTSALIVTAANTAVMYIDAKIYGYPVALFGIVLVTRILSGVVTAVVISLLIPPVIKRLKGYI